MKERGTTEKEYEKLEEEEERKRNNNRVCTYYNTTIQYNKPAIGQG